MRSNKKEESFKDWHGPFRFLEVPGNAHLFEVECGDPAQDYRVSSCGGRHIYGRIDLAHKVYIFYDRGRDGKGLGGWKPFEIASILDKKISFRQLISMIRQARRDYPDGPPGWSSKHNFH